MAEQGSIVIIGGSHGLGLELARHYVAAGRTVVLTSRDQGRADAAADDVGGDTTGLALDLAEPATIVDRLAGVGDVSAVLLVGVDRDENTVRDYDVDAAARLVTLKLVGYTEVVHALVPQLRDDASVVMFGGLAKDRPYPGSTTITTINGGVATLVHTLAVELAPVRVNAIHPGIVGDSPYWLDKPAAVLDAVRERTPLGRLVTSEEVVHATAFLVENTGVNGVNLALDGGWLLK